MDRKFFVIIVFTIFISVVGATSYAGELVFGAEDLKIASVYSPEETDGLVKRKRMTTINSDALFAKKVAGPLSSDQPLTFNLFEDVSFQASPYKMEVNVNNTWVWVGKFPEDTYGHAVLAVTDGVIMGEVRRHGELYEIRHAGGESYEIREINQALFPPEEPPLIPSVPEGEDFPQPPARDPDIEADDGSTIDIAVAYTASAASAAGSESAIKSLIASTVTTQNLGYDNSGIHTQVNLIGSAMASYTASSGHSAAVRAMQDTDDGVMDVIPVVRNNRNIDLVSLWINNNSACGVGYLYTSSFSSFSEWGYSTMHVGCASNYTMAHEMGHNMGSQHDVDNASSQGYYSYSYGYQQTSASSPYRSIMAYSCSGSSCPRANYWSSPDITYNGSSTGTSSANNAQSINNRRWYVANFRVSGDSGGDSGPRTYTVPLLSTPFVSVQVMLLMVAGAFLIHRRRR